MKMILRKLKLAFFPEYQFVIENYTGNLASEPLVLAELNQKILNNVADVENNKLHMQYSIFIKDIIDSGVNSGHISIYHSPDTSYSDNHYYISPTFFSCCNNYKLIKLTS